VVFGFQAAEPVGALITKLYMLESQIMELATSFTVVRSEEVGLLIATWVEKRKSNGYSDDLYVADNSKMRRPSTGDSWSRGRRVARQPPYRIDDPGYLLL